MQIKILIAIFLVGIMWVDTFSQKTIDTLQYSVDRFNKERYKMTQEAPFKAYNYFKNGADFFLERYDTVNHLFCISYLSDVELRKGEFNKAFDLLWDALPLANSIANKKPLLEINQMLGLLYEVYDMDSAALFHAQQGLEIAKEYANADSSFKDRLTSCYLDVAIQYVAQKDFHRALRYLDSCYITDNSNRRLHFVDGIYGQVYLEMNDFEKAQEHFNGVIPFLEKKGNGFQASVAYFVGKLKEATNQIDSARYYYKKSLNAIDSLKTQRKLEPLVLEQLGLLYFKENDFENAFNCMHKSKTLGDSLFNTKSEQNKALFEIKNSYKEKLIAKENQITVQNQLLKLSNKARFRLKLLIGLLLLLASILIISYRMRNKMLRVANEKKLSEEKNQAILEIKNKELTAHALQIIEKEQAIKEVLDSIKEENPKTYKTFQRKHKQSNQKMWEDFNLRFTQTNDQFYRRLLQKFPDITPNDLKHCALVKLNFDSKEMAQLLGISINSVHMARSRIRKKLGLKRADSLSGFLNGL